MARIYLPSLPQAPAKLSPELRNPLAGINEHCEQDNEEIRKLLATTASIQGRLLGLCIIVRSDLTSILNEGQEHIQKLSQTLPRDGMFFIMDEEGKHIFGGIPGVKVFQGMGSANAEVVEGLETYRKQMRSLPVMHTESFAEILGDTKGKLVLETGAGTDIARIKKLKEKTEAEGGLLICHDPAPYAAKLTQAVLPTVPYIATPARSELLVPILSASPRAKIITLKDTISSMTYGGLNELFFIAEQLNVEKIIMTQSLTIAPNANYFVEGAKPQSEFFDEYLMAKILKNISLFGGSRQKDLFLAFGEQLRMSITAIMLEIVRFKILRDLQAKGYKNCETWITSKSETLPPEQAQEFLDQYDDGYYPQFLKDTFNGFEFSPFGIKFSKDATVTEKQLKITQTQFHIIASKDRSGLTIGRQVPNSSIITPLNQRVIDICHVQAITGHTFTANDIQQLKPCLSYANRSAIDYIYHTLVEMVPQPDIIKSQKLDREKFIEGFVKNIK